MTGGYCHHDQTQPPMKEYYDKKLEGGLNSQLS
jgi:hypothetical protein